MERRQYWRLDRALRTYRNTGMLCSDVHTVKSCHPKQASSGGYCMGMEDENGG